MQEHGKGTDLGERGFTLIELLVVIAILGILAAVVVFSVNGITDRGKTSACKTEAGTVQTALEAFDAKNGGYPIGANLVGINVMTLPPDKFLNTAILGSASPTPSPTQLAPTPYVYTTSGATFSVTVDGNTKTVSPSGVYAGSCDS